MGMTSMDLTGLGCGLAAALLMAAAFAFSTWAIRSVPGLSAPGLLANASCAMGLLSLAGLAFVWRPGLLAGFWERFPALLGIVGAYWIAQCAVFIAQRKVDASQLVPLLGLKLPMLALLNALLCGSAFNGWQLLSIAVTVAAAFVLNNAGRHIPLSSFAFLLLGCLFYCLSDMCIQVEVQQIHARVTPSLPLASAQCTFLTYILSGIVGASILPFGRSMRIRGAMPHSLPYAVCWVSSIVFLTVCFARLGTVNGNIVQATRGVFAVLLAPVLVCFGLTRLELRTGWKINLRRLAAAVMMTAAILIYNLH